MTTQNPPISAIKKLLAPNVKAKFSQVLGNRADQFIVSVQTALNSTSLSDCQDFDSILGASLTAATLDLPVNPNLGFAYIIPYQKNYQDKTTRLWEKTPAVAQFQIGYKGFIQLAQRSGLFKTINASMVKDGELIAFDRKTGYLDFDWKVSGRETLKNVGCVAYFQLLNGFEKTLFMTIEELQAHGIKYSQSYKSDKNKSSLWNTNFDAMAQKTCLKLLLSKYAPLSTAMQKAVETDQAVVAVNEDDVETIVYADNRENVVEVKATKTPLMVFITEQALTIEALEKVKDKDMSAEEQTAYLARWDELNKLETENN